MIDLTLSNLIGTLKDTFKIKRLTLDASPLTAPRTLLLPDSNVNLGDMPVSSIQQTALNLKQDISTLNDSVSALPNIVGAIDFNDKFRLAYNAGTNSLDITYIG